MKTCGNCHHIVLFHGMNKGECYYAPPSLTNAGVTVRPKVGQRDRACSFHAVLPEGASAVLHEKLSPETPGDAIKQKREELAQVPGYVPPAMLAAQIKEAKQKKGKA